MIEYSILQPKEANWEELYEFLKSVDDNFIPPLSVKIDLELYAKKLADNATNFIARDNNVLIGFSSTYVNKAPEMSFGSFICVKNEYRKDGMIGVDMIMNAVAYCKEFGSKGVWCMIRKSDKALWKLYKALGFSIVEEVPVKGSDVVELHIEKIFSK